MQQYASITDHGLAHDWWKVPWWPAYILQDLRFSQHWCWGFWHSGLFHFVVSNTWTFQRNIVHLSSRVRMSKQNQGPLKLKTSCSFETLGYVELSTTQYNIPEDQKPSLHICFSDKQSRLGVVHAVSLFNSHTSYLAIEPVGLEISDGTQNGSRRWRNKVNTTWNIFIPKNFHMRNKHAYNFSDLSPCCLCNAKWTSKEHFTFPIRNKHHI
jgi:hypothetical protein